MRTVTHTTTVNHRRPPAHQTVRPRVHGSRPLRRVAQRLDRDSGISTNADGWTSDEFQHSSISASAGAQLRNTDKASETEMNWKSAAHDTRASISDDIGSTESRLAALRRSLDYNESDRPCRWTRKAAASRRNWSPVRQTHRTASVAPNVGRISRQWEQHGVPKVRGSVHGKQRHQECRRERQRSRDSIRSVWRPHGVPFQ